MIPRSASATRPVKIGTKSTSCHRMSIDKIISVLTQEAHSVRVKSTSLSCHVVNATFKIIILFTWPEMCIQWSAVRVTAVTVTVGYSDSFCNPRFISTKRQAVTVTKNRLQ